jgi:hypothetical protein
MDITFYPNAGAFEPTILIVSRGHYLEKLVVISIY